MSAFMWGGVIGRCGVGDEADVGMVGSEDGRHLKEKLRGVRMQLALGVGVKESLGGGRMSAVKDQSVWEDRAENVIQVVEEKEACGVVCE